MFQLPILNLNIIVLASYLPYEPKHVLLFVEYDRGYTKSRYQYRRLSECADLPLFGTDVSHSDAPTKTK